MKEKSLLFIGIISVILVVAAIGYYFYGKNNIIEVCFKDRCYAVELAQTETQRARGLMYRDKLDSDKGMFFIFDKEDIYPFWMKNMLIPLDIIWLDKNMKVVYIYKGALPCGQNDYQSITPPVVAKYVLEINAGGADKTGIKEGDVMVFN
jgi:uncharacterized membrane protein (UPF0127 family)